MAADTLIGSLDFPPNDARATLIKIDPTAAMTRTPTTVLLTRSYYPVDLEALGYRYSLKDTLRGSGPASGVITVPQVEASALEAASGAVAV